MFAIAAEKHPFYTYICILKIDFITSLSDGKTPISIKLTSWIYINRNVMFVVVIYVLGA